jgi:carbamoyl-phosphate synthase large subunit
VVGFNEPDILIRSHLLGERVAPRFPYGAGNIMRGLVEVYIAKGKEKGVFKPGVQD